MYIIEKPKVLFVGSGVLQAFGGESWDKFLDSISQRNDIDHSIDCPAPLKAIILTNDHVDTALKEKFSKSTGAEITNPDLASFLQDTLSIGFDHILTTNYTYELEAASVYPSKLSEYRIKKMQTSTAGRCEPKYLLHTVYLINKIYIFYILFLLFFLNHYLLKLHIELQYQNVE